MPPLLPFHLSAVANTDGHQDPDGWPRGSGSSASALSTRPPTPGLVLGRSRSRSRSHSRLSVPDRLTPSTQPPRPHRQRYPPNASSTPTVAAAAAMRSSNAANAERAYHAGAGGRTPVSARTPRREAGSASAVVTASGGHARERALQDPGLKDYVRCGDPATTRSNIHKDNVANNCVRDACAETRRLYRQRSVRIRLQGFQLGNRRGSGCEADQDG